MRKFSVLGLMLALLFISGCALHLPQTAEEFRQVAPGAFMSKVVNFEVNRPLSQVSSSYKKMAPKCLDKRVTSTSTRYSKYGGQTSTVVVDYKPTVKATKTKAEVHVQQKFVSGVISVQKEPPGGVYLLVADAVPAGRKKTKVTIYTASVYKELIKGIENWSNGKHLCPDLTK
jgi:hypothetical protein